MENKCIYVRRLLQIQIYIYIHKDIDICTCMYEHSKGIQENIVNCNIQYLPTHGIELIKGKITYFLYTIVLFESYNNQV